SRRDDWCETDRLCTWSKRTNGFQELETSTKRKTHLAEMILREIVQDVGVDRVLAEYRLILFEAKALQPTSDVHDGALTSARRTLSKPADAPHPLAMLRTCRERPRCRAAEQRDELAAFHCPMPPVLPTERIAHLGTADCCIHPPGHEMIAITPPIIFSK